MLNYSNSIPDKELRQYNCYQLLSKYLNYYQKLMSYLITYFAVFKRHEIKTVIFDHIKPLKNTPECSL